ncbi:MAG TPA: SLBB domain-containing protein [Pyrinomonadaceae bacterium]|jgi:protein involved in polysaccharide export with SLBB domain|nr:SLBB domain-containing protein [Pyrinomonadaceae bacterium]
MKKLIPLATILITCFGFIAVEAQVDRAKDPNVACVVVTGAVNMPMRFELKEQRRVRVLEAVAFAGGLTKYAGGTIRLIRTEQPCYAEAWAHKAWPDHPLKITELTTGDTLRGDENSNPYLNPGDVVLVVASDPIYVSGNVAKPQTIYFKETPNLLRAIALAGGAVGATRETKVVIYRAGDDRHYKELLRVSLSELKKHPERSPVLQRNDIIDVGPAAFSIPPPSPPKFDAPPSDSRPTGPAPDRVKSGIATR